MPWARASALARHLECAAASNLPRLDRGVWSPPYIDRGEFDLTGKEDIHDGRDMSAANWGTASHLGKSDPSKSSEPFTSMWAEHRDVLYPPHLGAHEAAVSYNCDTGEIVWGPVNQDVAVMDAWKASQPLPCVTGTIDWIGQLQNTAWVDDLKTGWQVPEVATPQMLFAAVCASKRYGSNIVYISITHWPKKNSAPNRDGLWYKAGPVTLLAFEEDMRAAWLRARSNFDARPGTHCKYCPSIYACERA